jgi:hypothetical protein
MCLADGSTISGNLTPLCGTTEIYNVTWQDWNSTYETHAQVTWSVDKGIIISYTNHSIVIEWNNCASEGYFDVYGSISVSESLGGQQGSVGVFFENLLTSSPEFCNGILGPPSVVVNFGSGNNPGAPLPSGATTYQYGTNCALQVGEYTIRNNSINCRGLWHNLTQDHTGNPNGYFLMINANDSRNEVYRAGVSNLNPSFRYEFSAWVGNLYVNGSGQDPNIRFEIYANGGLIARSGLIAVTVTAPTFQWQRIGFMFDIPPGVSSLEIVVVNTRNTTANEGNDMVIDDISFAPCYPSLLASFSNSGIVDRSYTCNNGTVNLFSSWPSVIPFNNPSYQWQRSANNGGTWANISGATSSNYTQTEPNPGIYMYRMYCYETATPAQYVISNEITYYVQLLVVEPRTTDFLSCNGSIPSGHLLGLFNLLYSEPNNPNALSYTYSWSPATYLNSPNSYSPFAIFPTPPPPPAGGNPPQPINYTYTLTVTNTNYGCVGSNTQIARVKAIRKVGVANAFAPAQASPNNVFVPINIEDQPGSEFSVWNRWGQRIFYSTGPTKLDYTWNGTYQGVLQPGDVYFWAVNLIGCPGFIYSASNGNGVPYGNVTLLR